MMSKDATKPSLIIDVEPEAEGKPPARKECCGNCSGSHFPGTAVMGECRAGPPTHAIFMVPRQDPIRGVVPSYQGQGGWPPVKRDQWCRDKYQPKVVN